MLDNLPIVRVERVDRKKKGFPQIVSIVPKQKLFLGDSLQWQIWAVDPNEPSNDLAYSYQGSLPKGVVWDTRTHSLKGLFKKTGTYSFSLIAQNPDQKADTLQVQLKVISNKKPIIVNAPNETVKVGEDWSYTPYLSDLDHPAGMLKLKVLQSPKTMKFDSETNTFSWEPNDSLSNQTTSIKLRVEDPLGASNTRIFSIKVLPEKKNSPPLIIGILPNWEVEQGKKEVYIPMVIEPDRDSYQLGITLSDSSLVQINGARVELSTKKVGTYSAEVLARDEHGAEARQRIAWKVIPRPTLSYKGLYLERHDYGANSPNWDLGYQFKQSRIGLFLPSWSALAGYEAKGPLVYVGANLMPFSSVDKGNYFFTDIGLNYRFLAPELITGGLFVRLDGRANLTEGFIKSRVEMEMKIYSQTGILILNRHTNDYASINYDDPESLSSLLEDTTLIQKYNKDNQRSDNIVMYSRMEILYHLGYNFWMGPLINRLNIVKKESFKKYFGLGTRYELDTRYMSGQQAFRFSWSNDGFLFNMLTKLSFRTW